MLWPRVNVRGAKLAWKILFKLLEIALFKNVQSSNRSIIVDIMARAENSHKTMMNLIKPGISKVENYFGWKPPPNNAFKLNTDAISIVGKAGLGKTTLAEKIYQSSDVKKHFDCCTWVYVSQEYRAREILQDLCRKVGKAAFPDAKNGADRKEHGSTSNEPVGLILKECKILQVLDLEGVYMALLDSSIGNLIHLRYLDLRKTWLKKLPSSMGNLFNLQSLDLSSTLVDPIPLVIWKMQ
ncbi:hypothetical protein WN944_014047 [Citrus x changshan-huyou]|uniref:NB-ARC domain-containing protein n=1 Tax=Citrus x changshan-huyou TaxID=2935761 RepID=A0AAP0QKF5_9ROSI